MSHSLTLTTEKNQSPSNFSSQSKESSSRKTSSLHDFFAQNLNYLLNQLKNLGKRKLKIEFLPLKEEIVALHKEQSVKMREMGTILKELTTKPESLKKSLCLLKITEENDWRKNISPFFKRVSENRKAYDLLEQNLKNCLNITCYSHGDVQRRTIENARHSLEKLLEKLGSTSDDFEEEKYRVVIREINELFDYIIRRDDVLDKENTAFHRVYDSTHLRFKKLYRNEKYNQSFKKLLSENQDCTPELYAIFEEAFSSHLELKKLNSVSELTNKIDVLKKTQQAIIKQKEVIEALEKEKLQLKRDFEESKNIFKSLWRSNMEERVKFRTSSIAKQKEILSEMKTELVKICAKYIEERSSVFTDIGNTFTKESERLVRREASRLKNLIEKKKEGMGRITEFCQAQKNSQEDRMKIIQKIKKIRNSFPLLESVFIRKIRDSRHLLSEKISHEKLDRKVVFPLKRVVKDQLNKYREALAKADQAYKQFCELLESEGATSMDPVKEYAEKLIEAQHKEYAQYTAAYSLYYFDLNKGRFQVRKFKVDLRSLENKKK